MSVLSLLKALESFYRSLNYPVGLRGNFLLVRGDVPFVIEATPDNLYLRVAVVTEVEPSPEDLEALLKRNFLAYGVKFSIDTEGYLAIVSEAPTDCLEDKGPSFIHETLVLPAISSARELGRLFDMKRARKP